MPQEFDIKCVVSEEDVPGGLKVDALPKSYARYKKLFEAAREVRKIDDFRNAVADAGRTYSPALVANYAYDLAKEYNQFYHDFSILKEENEPVRNLRLELSAVTARTLKAGLALLGIEVPERM